MADQLFDVRCGYDFVLVDRLVYTKSLACDVGGLCSVSKNSPSTLIRMPQSRSLGIIHTRLMKALEASSIHSFTH